VHPATKSVALRLVTSVVVENVKQCFISATAATQIKLEGGLPQLHLAEDATVQWLMSHGS